MENIHQEARLATTGPKEEKLSKDLNKVIDETNPKAARAKALLTVRAVEGSSCRRAIMHRATGCVCSPAVRVSGVSSLGRK